MFSCAHRAKNQTSVQDNETLGCRVILEKHDLMYMKESSDALW